MIVGDLKERSLARLIDGYEKDFGFPIRYTTMVEKEFKDRRQMMDKFIYAMFEAQNVRVVNKFNI